MVTHPDPTKPAGRIRYSFIDGNSITAATYRKLLPGLVPVRDGLFPEISQTFAWRSEE